MLTPLLATKLFIQPARANRVPRPRLIEQLNILRPLTLIAEGNHGQFIYISPHKNLIILRFGKSYGSFHGSKGWLDMFYSFASNLDTQ